MTTYTIGPANNLQKAVDKLGPGDELVLKKGTYKENITTKLMGTAEKPIVIRGEDPSDRPVISGGTPRTVVEAQNRSVDINYGLPPGNTNKWAKRNMNTGSPQYGAKAIAKGLFHCQTHSGNYIVKDLILTDSAGRIWNHEAENSNISRNITFINVTMQWARLQVASFKRVGNLRFIDCEFSEAATFYRTTGRPRFGPKGDLQTHNACLSLGDVDGYELIGCYMHDSCGEGLITTANTRASRKGKIIDFTGADCYRSPIYGHSPEDLEINGMLLYRSRENMAAKGSDIRKTGGLTIAPSEGNKPWDNPARNVHAKNVICHHTDFGLRLTGSMNTVPVNDISFKECITVNVEGFALSLKSNQPKNVIVSNNLFFDENKNKELGFAYPNRYDNSSSVHANAWTKKPTIPFLTSPTDKITSRIDITTDYLPKGTRLKDIMDIPTGPPDPPDPEEPTLSPPIMEQAEAEGNNILVEWGVNAEHEIYRLQQRYNGNGWKLIEKDVTFTEIIYNDMEAGKYEYRVRGSDRETWSGWSRITSVTISDKPEPPDGEDGKGWVQINGQIYTITLEKF